MVLQLGDKVNLFCKGEFRREITVVALNVPNGLDNLPSFQASDGSLFYASPEDGKYYNVGNKAFYVEGK